MMTLVNQSAAFQGWVKSVADDPLQSDQCAEMLRALSEPIRLRIVDCLRSGPKNVGEIGEALDAEIVTVSHHLGILKNAGIVERERQGRFMLYKLREGVIETKRSSSPDHLNLGCCRLEIPK
jgi:DNA-binding transcriptional ArsR family regulator